MTITVRAVYENGVLRPVEPLALPEGVTVAVTITAAGPSHSVMRAPSQEEESYSRRLKAARSLDEMFAVMANAPRLPEALRPWRRPERQPESGRRATRFPRTRR